MKDGGQDVQVDEATLKKLDISSAVASTTTGRLDRFPVLNMDKCLEGAASALTQAVVASFRAGVPVRSETLTLPRRGFGPRPVTITTPGVRALYSSLVGNIANELPQDGRSNARWEAHNNFGKPKTLGEGTYLVEFDIASCYEYISHGRLRDELVLRTMDTTHANYIAALLGEMFPRGYGLPQLTRTSDALADAYLEVIERELLRGGRSLSRFADDFKVLASSWGESNQVIEDAAEYARDIGLILSTEKTHIWTSDWLFADEADRQNFLWSYFESARDELTQVDFIMNRYGDDGEPITIEPSQLSALRAALRKIFSVWVDAQHQPMPRHEFFLTAALDMLADESESRLPDEWLIELVFRQPIRLESVCNYLLSRSNEPEESWTTTAKLAAMERQSPWAKLWLLSVARSLPLLDTADARAVGRWASRQLDDKHETLRAEAAWYLTREDNGIGESALASLYARASSLTRPLLAACCGSRGLAQNSGLVKAVASDNKLTLAAYQWGCEHG